MNKPNKGERQQLANNWQALLRVRKSLKSMHVKMEINGRDPIFKNATGQAIKQVETAIAALEKVLEKNEPT